MNVPRELFVGVPPSQWGAVSRAYYRGVADAEPPEPPVKIGGILVSPAIVDELIADGIVHRVKKADET